MCADGGPADAQTKGGDEMERDPQAGAQWRYRAQTTVSHSALSAIFRSSAGPWSTGLLGVSNRARGRVETTPDRRLGSGSDYHSGRVLSVHQDVRLETGAYLRHSSTLVVAQLCRAIDLGRYWTIWCRRKGGWRGNAHIAVGFNSPCI